MVRSVPKTKSKDSKAQHRQTCLLSFWGKAVTTTKSSASSSSSSSNSSSRPSHEPPSNKEGAAAGMKRKLTNYVSSSRQNERNKKQKELAMIGCLSSSLETNKPSTTTTNAVSPTTTTTRPCNDTIATTKTTIIEEDEETEHEKREGNENSCDVTTAVPTTSNKGRPSLSETIDPATNNDCGDESKNSSTANVVRKKKEKQEDPPDDNNNDHSNDHSNDGSTFTLPLTCTSTERNHNESNHDESSAPPVPVPVPVPVAVESTTTITHTTTHVKADDTNSIDDGLSDYERLRMRNIERNNARLVALGLVVPHEKVTKRETRRNRPKANASKPTTPMPTRRSTRNRQSYVVHEGDDSKPTTAADVDVDVDGVCGDPVEETEAFTVSPLWQYAMTTNEEPHTGNTVEAANDMAQPQQAAQGEMTSLSPVGPRLQPPKGLGAIYTLQFCPSFHNNTNTNTNITSRNNTWLVGAGKAGMVALWDCHLTNTNPNPTGHEAIDPVLSWKAHGGRWIAEARFVPGPAVTSTTNTPSRLLTAANDGTVCLWDLTTVAVPSGVPKQLRKSGKELHTSGIFAMDVSVPDNTHNYNNYNEIMVCTGSKDKTVAVSSLESIGHTAPMWRSDYHTAKVGAVQLRGMSSTLLASASDDGCVVIHDYRTTAVVAALKQAHERPHSVVWEYPYEYARDHDRFLTAGLDNVIKLWDLRNTSQPLASFHGHVPSSTHRCKKIHRPTFYSIGGDDSDQRSTRSSPSTFILTGGQGSHSLSMFQHKHAYEYDPVVGAGGDGNGSSLFPHSRGKLPSDCGDVGCIAVDRERVAISVEDGTILMLAPSH